MSLHDLNRRTGLDESTISRIERGRTNRTNIEYVFLLCQGLGIPVSRLLQECGWESADGEPVALAPDEPATAGQLEDVRREILAAFKRRK